MEKSPESLRRQHDLIGKLRSSRLLLYSPLRIVACGSLPFEILRYFTEGLQDDSVLALADIGSPLREKAIVPMLG